MKRYLRIGLIAVQTALVLGAELEFDFSNVRPGEAPVGWRSELAGTGGVAGEWKIQLEDVDPLLAPISANAPKVKKAVLAQTALDATDERFPLLVWEGERFGDFTWRARLKLVGGQKEQIAGLAFRIQDPKNFYVARVSALGHNVRFYKFVDGQRSNPIGPNIPFAAGEWHELAVETLANRIRILIDGKEAMPPLDDYSFPNGKIGFLTKSDSIALFADARITFRPLETVAQSLVRHAMEKNPRFLGVKVFGSTPENPELRVLASNNSSELNAPATLVERNVVADRQPFAGKTGAHFLVTMPLHDRNGDTVGAAKFVLPGFKGQTEANALARIQPSFREMERRLAAAKDLIE